MIPVTDNDVDLRCASRGARKRRCQLLVGHEAGHAAMALEGSVRVIKTWNAGQLRRQVPAEEACRFPWAPGLPSVAEDLARHPQPALEPPRPAVQSPGRPPALLAVAAARPTGQLTPVA